MHVRRAHYGNTKPIINFCFDKNCTCSFVAYPVYMCAMQMCVFFITLLTNYCSLKCVNFWGAHTKRWSIKTAFSFQANYTRTYTPIFGSAQSALIHMLILSRVEHFSKSNQLLVEKKSKKLLIYKQRTSHLFFCTHLYKPRTIISSFIIIYFALHLY